MLTSMLKNKKLFIFDMDGTLIESLGVWNEADRLFIKNLTGIELDAVLIGGVRDKFLGECTETNPYAAWIKHLMSLYNIDGNLEDLIEYRKNICDTLIFEMVKLKPYAKELLTLLKRYGYKISLGTVGAPNSLNRLLHELEATRFLGDGIFDFIVDSSSVSKLKPSPDLHLKALEHFNMEPDDAIVIEDSYVGLEAANNASIDSIIVREDFASNKEELKRDAKFYVDSLEDIYNSMLKIVENKPKLR